MTTSVQILPKSPVQAPRPGPLVVALVYDGLCTFEFACVAEVFGLPRPEFEPGWYRFETCSVERRQIQSQYGFRMTPSGGLERLIEAETIVIPGWRIDVPVPARMTEALHEAHRRGARLMSVCTGAFVLAATGLLDGRRAATHWRYAAKLQARHPEVHVDPDVLYVDEGQLLTSAGSAAGLDLCLHLVRRDHGPAVANQVARRLVAPPHRDGGQAQFIERPVQPRERNALSSLLDHMRLRPADPLPVSEMARLAAMSERTFVRRFKAATGTTPANWLTTARVDQARQLLEESSFSVDEIALRCGFGSAVTLRHHFRTRLGISPSAYRDSFSNSPGAR